MRAPLVSSSSIHLQVGGPEVPGGDRSALSWEGLHRHRHGSHDRSGTKAPGGRSTLRGSAPGRVLDGFTGPGPVNPTVVSSGRASALGLTAMGRSKRRPFPPGPVLVRLTGLGPPVFFHDRACNAAVGCRRRPSGQSRGRLPPPPATRRTKTPFLGFRPAADTQRVVVTSTVFEQVGSSVPDSQTW